MVQAGSAAEAEELAAQIPELTCASSPPTARRTSSSGDPRQLSLTPEDLGVRITYFASQPPSEKSAPDCDLAVPLA